MARERTVKVTLVGDASSIQRAFQQGAGAAGKFEMGLGKVARLVGIGGFALALKKGATAAVNLASDFELSMAKIVGLVGVSRDQVDAWGQDIIEMAPKLGKAPQELAEGLFFVTSAGIRGAAAMDVLEKSAKASAAGLGETKVIADLVTSAINAYGEENLSAGQATDILVNAVREGKAEASDMAAVLGNVLPVASEMGVTFDQVAASVAAMTRTGTDAATATTQLRAIMVGLLKPAAQAEAQLAAMGTSSQEMRDKIRNDGLLSALSELRDLTNQYGEDAVAKVFPNVRALAGTLDLMGSNAEDNVAVFESLADSTGVLDEAFAAVADTAAFKFQQALAEMQTIGIEVGQQMLPMIVDGLQTVTPWLVAAGGAAADFVAGIDTVVGIIGDLPGAAKLAVVALGGILTALKLVIAHPVVAGIAAIAAGIALIGDRARENRDEVAAMAEDVERLGRIELPTIADSLGAIPGKDIARLRELGVTLEDVRTELEKGPDSFAKWRYELTTSGASAKLSAKDSGELSRALEHLGNQFTDASVAAKRAENERRTQIATETGYLDVLRQQGAVLSGEAIPASQRATGAFGEQTDAALDLEEALGDAEGATEDLAEETKSLEQRLLDATAAQESLSGVMRDAADPVANAITRVKNYEDAVADLDAKQKDGKTSAEDLANAQIEVGLKALEAQAALDEISLDDLDAAIQAFATSTGLSREAVVDLLAQLGILDGKKIRAILEIQAPIVRYAQEGQRLVPRPGGHIMMEKGGITRPGKAVDAIVGEGSAQEAVIPLDQRGIHFMVEAMRQALGGRPNAAGMIQGQAEPTGLTHELLRSISAGIDRLTESAPPTVEVGQVILQGLPGQVAFDVANRIASEARWS